MAGEKPWVGGITLSLNYQCTYRTDLGTGGDVAFQFSDGLPTEGAYSAFKATIDKAKGSHVLLSAYPDAFVTEDALVGIH